MAAEGKILRLDLAGSDSRYDGQTAPHGHVRCRVCGTVADIPPVAVDPPGDTAGFLLEDCAVVYRGLCPACRKVREDIHPDVTTVRDPDHKFISVDAVREVRRDAYIAPTRGGGRSISSRTAPS